MLKRENMLPALALLVFAACALGVAQLFKLRFETGDVYPEYSSLRADPLGAKAFYASLEKLPRVQVRRHYQPLNRVSDGRDTTLLFLGTKIGAMEDTPEEEAQDLEKFMTAGGRIVISFFPTSGKPASALREERRSLRSRTRTKAKTPDPPAKRAKPEKENQPRDAKPPKQKKPMPPENEDLPGSKLVSLTERWGVKVDYADLPRNQQGKAGPVAATKKADISGLPDDLSWRTALHFASLDDNWKVVYGRDKHPVIIARKFGGGALVLSADSYFLSNEALRLERQPELLAWLIGPHSRVVFDETHLGTWDKPGIAALARKYRLHGVFAGLLLLAGLFVWKNAVSFVPPDLEPADSSDPVAGRESAAGFVNALRRNTPPSNILNVCFEEWKKTCAHGRKDLSRELARVKAIVNEENARPAGERRPVETYRSIRRILSHRFGARTSSGVRVLSSELPDSKGVQGSRFKVQSERKRVWQRSNGLKTSKRGRMRVC